MDKIDRETAKAIEEFIKEHDFVRVVRCHKCKHWLPGTITETDTFEPPFCMVLKTPMHGDDYCPYGDRRETEEQNNG